MNVLEVASDVASILTALAAVGAAAYYSYDRYNKRVRLERYLKKEMNENSRYKAHSVLHLMAELGMTEGEIFQAAFSSRRVWRHIRKDDSTGLAANILFKYFDDGSRR